MSEDDKSGFLRRSIVLPKGRSLTESLIERQRVLRGDIADAERRSKIAEEAAIKEMVLPTNDKRRTREIQLKEELATKTVAQEFPALILEWDVEERMKNDAKLPWKKAMHQKNLGEIQSRFQDFYTTENRFQLKDFQQRIGDKRIESLGYEVTKSGKVIPPEPTIELKENENPFSFKASGRKLEALKSKGSGLKNK